jgi:hypothetical protein
VSIATPPADAGTSTSPAPALADGRPDEAEILRAWGREMDWLDAEWSKGTFAEYVGEYIITAEHKLLAHNIDLHDAYVEAEGKADELGIPRWKLANYYC